MHTLTEGLGGRTIYIGKPIDPQRSLHVCPLIIVRGQECLTIFFRKFIAFDHDRPPRLQVAWAGGQASHFEDTLNFLTLYLLPGTENADAPPQTADFQEVHRLLLLLTRLLSGTAAVSRERRKLLQFVKGAGRGVKSPQKKKGEDREEEERFSNPQPGPFLAELISRLVQEAVEAGMRTEEEGREKRREALSAQEEAPRREETPQRPSPSPRRVRYNLD